MKKLILFALLKLVSILSFGQVTRAQNLSDIDATIYTNRQAATNNKQSALIVGANFIGTIDNIPFNIRANNIKTGEVNRNLLNTFLGSEAGLLDITGALNMISQLLAMRDYALESNTMGNYNPAIGVSALDFNEGGSNNTSTGFKSLYENVSGNDNTAIEKESSFHPKK